MKNCFIAVRRVKDKNGKNFCDDDGAFYLEEHTAPPVYGKEFTSHNELIATLQDYKRETVFDAKGNREQKELIGEVIILNVLEF